MKRTLARLATLSLLAAIGPARAETLRCTTDAGTPPLWLVPDHRGGSMGNPAQRGAYLLREARGGPVLLQCPRGFRNGSLECARHALGPPPGHFRLDRASGAFELAFPGRAAPGDPVSGHCAPGG